MKKLLLIPLLFIGGQSLAQSKFPPTKQIVITGNIIKNDTINFNDLKQYKDLKIKDIKITNHLGAYRSTLTDLRGILLTNILSDITLDQENPKEWSRYVFWIEANDGYKVSFSWNELFNNEVGKHVYLITQEGNKNLDEMENELAIISTTDQMTGRRFVKRVQKITVMYQ